MEARFLRTFIITAAILAGGSSGLHAGEVDLANEIRGAGIYLSWTVSPALASQLRGFYLQATDERGTRLAWDRLPADARSRFLPVWLALDQRVTVRLLILRTTGMSLGMGAEAVIEGPFKQVDLVASGEVSNVEETSCRLSKLAVSGEGGEKAEIGVFAGPDLLETVKAGETEVELAALRPGTRYSLALIPFLPRDGKRLRGERTLLPSFATPIQDGWAEVNGGLPLNGDEPIDTRYRGAQAFSDKAGNLLFTIPSKDLGPGMGRYSIRSGTWEVRGLEGWTATKTLPVRPFLDGLFRVRHIDARLGPSGGVFGLVGCSTSAGKEVLDIHGSLHHFRWTGEEWEQWTGGTGYSRYDSRPLFNTWTGTSAGWSFDMNKGGVGLAVHVKKSLSASGRLIAVRLDFRNAKDRWTVWTKDGWKPHGYGNAYLPDPAPPKALEDIQPRIVCLDNKHLWLVLFRRAPKGSGTPGFWAAMRYNDKLKTWARWTVKGWQARGEAAEFLSLPVEPRTARLFRESGNRVYLVGEKGRDLVRVEYKYRSKRWGAVETLGRLHAPGRYGPAYRAVVSPGGKLVIAYSETGDDISIAGRGKVYCATAGIKLLALAFCRRTPVAFFSQKGALKAVSERKLPGEKPDSPTALSEPKEKKPDSAVVEYQGSFVNFAKDPEVPEGARAPVTPSYGPQRSGHMAATPGGMVFAPRYIVCNLCIFPAGHPDKPATFWGGFWDYFYFPMGVAVDDKRGKVYVAHRVTCGGCGGILGGVVDIWDLKNATKCHWSKPGLRGTRKPREVKPGRIDDRFRWPSGMAVDAERGFLYVANSLENDVRMFDLSGETPKRRAVLGDGTLDFPRGVAVDSAGNVYVVDSRHHRVCVFDSNGSLLRAFGKPGRAVGEFLFPWGIAVDPRTGLVFVSDPQNGRIQVFDREGAFVTWWNRFDVKNLDGSESRPSPIRMPGYSSGPPGNHEQSFGLACDARGFLYVSTGSYIARFRITRKH